jgi:predicted transcriptional regulator
MVSTTTLLRSAPDKPLATLLERMPTTLQAQASLVSASSLQAWQQQHALPVLDRQQNFVGVLHRSELDRALALGSTGSNPMSISDTLLEASEAYWSGLSALVRASFSLLTSPSSKGKDSARDQTP